MRPRTLLDADAVDVNGFELQGLIQHKKVCGVARDKGADLVIPADDLGRDGGGGQYSCF